MLCVSSLVAVAFAFGTQDATQPGDLLPPAIDILAKTEAALGDAKRRAEPKAIVMKGAMQVGGPGAAHEQVFVGRDRVKISSSFGSHGTVTQGQTPEFCWSTDPAVGITIRQGTGRLGVARGYAVERRAPWTELYSSARTVGVASIDGRDTFELDMTPKDGGDADRWFVDAQTYLPTAFGTLLPNPQGGSLGVRFVFSEWRDVQGLKLPFKKRMEIGDIALDIAFDSISLTESVTDEAIQPPAEVMAAFEDPSKRAKEAPPAGTCTVETIPEQVVVSIRTTIKETDVARSLAQLYPEIMRGMDKAGVAPVAPPFARFHKIENGEIDFEAGIAVNVRPKSVDGRVRVSTLPGGATATTWHVGAYHDLPKTCALLEKWIMDEGHAAAGGHWEVYWTDPGIEPDASKWRTQLLWPIARD